MRKTTTPVRLYISPGLIAEVAERALSAGCSLDEMAAELLLKGLPVVVALAVERGLKASSGRATPTDVECKRTPPVAITGGVQEHLVGAQGYLDGVLPPPMIAPGRQLLQRSCAGGVR